MVKEEGVMLEKPLHLYKSFDGRTDLDISEETALTEAKLKELICRNASEDTIRHTMKKIGTRRCHISFITCKTKKSSVKSFTCIHHQEWCY